MKYFSLFQFVFGSPLSTHFRRNWSHSMRRKFFPANSGHQNESGTKYFSLFHLTSMFLGRPHWPTSAGTDPTRWGGIFLRQIQVTKIWIWNNFCFSLFQYWYFLMISMLETLYFWKVCPILVYSLDPTSARTNPSFAEFRLSKWIRNQK